LHAAPGKGTRLELEVQIAKISDSHVS